MKRKDSVTSASLKSPRSEVESSVHPERSRGRSESPTEEMGKKRRKSGKTNNGGKPSKKQLEFLVRRSSNTLSMVNVRQPAEFGNFSLSSDRTYCDDDRQLRDYMPPKTNSFKFDLNVGYEGFIRRNEEEPERLDNMLHWLQRHGHRFRPADGKENDASMASFNTDFIAWRGMFTKILCTPYEKREPWLFAAVKFCGSIFLCEIETAYKRNERQNRPARLEKMCYWGFKFEDYTTIGKGGESNSDGIINNIECFSSVVRTRFESHSIVVGAEVDCRDATVKEKAPANYIELKTTRHMDSRFHWEKFVRNKLLKYWAQSFLAGVPKIICGLRDDDGTVDELQEFKTLDIPKISRQVPGSWDANVCLDFANHFLSFVKETVTEEGPDNVYMFHFYEPYRSVTVREVFGEGKQFLPGWFVSSPMKA